VKAVILPAPPPDEVAAIVAALSLGDESPPSEDRSKWRDSGRNHDGYHALCERRRPVHGGPSIR
jgi:hypothetical protein